MKDGKGRYSDIAPARQDAEFNRAIVLARIFGASPHGWVLKGGNALLWRDTKARATRDIDLFSTQSTIQDAHKALQDILIRRGDQNTPGCTTQQAESLQKALSSI